jgi:DNA-binding NtrC family response regulator
VRLPLDYKSVKLSQEAQQMDPKVKKRSRPATNVHKPAEIIGSAYQKPKELTESFARLDLPVLFFGETGSGKELFATHYMDTSTREGKRRIINCAEFTSEILASEVFGHVQGAFTGAIRDRAGLFKTCKDGILFLDELGEASPDFQSAILRAVEGNSFRPVGSDDESSSDVTVIAATSNLSRIREDLKQRFHILMMPPLQKCDIFELSKYFLKKPLKQEILMELASRDFPGNVRELEKSCQRLRIEGGETIFSKTHITPIQGEFDYRRFSLEAETWQRYFQPIIDRHNLRYRYRYLPRPDMESVSKFEREVGSSGLQLSAMLNLLGHGVEKIESHNPIPSRRISELLPAFIRKMDAVFQRGVLPFVLEKFVSEIAGKSTDYQVITDDIGPYLNMSYDEALGRFALRYLDKQIEKHGTIREAAKQMVVNEHTFRNRRARVKQRLHKISRGE